MLNKVVARYANGNLVKGSTGDFFPEKQVFHVTLPGPPAAAVEVRLAELKALFFVRDFAGNPSHEERKEFDSERPPAGRKIRVEFRDGEVLVGTTQGYQPDRLGFFLVPADASGNNERCYVVATAVREVRFIV